MKTPDRSGWSERTQPGIDGSTSGGFEIRNDTQRGSIASPAANASRSGGRPGARRSAAMSVPSSRSMISCDRSSWVRRLPPGRRGSAGAREGRQDVLVEEVGERPVPDVVEQAGDAQRLDDEALGRDGLAGRQRQRRAERRVERPGPEAGLVHDAEAVGEPGVLGRREDPAGALELADAPEALQPRGVEEVLLGDVLGGSPASRASSGASRFVSST